METIIKALQTTHNIETYKTRLNEHVNAHITKLDIFGNKFLIEYESNGQLLHSIVATAEEAINL